MAASAIRLGIAGCGSAARAHLGRLLALDHVRVVGFADPDPVAAQALAQLVPAAEAAEPAAVCTDYRELLRSANLDALAIFTPHRSHYRLAMDALQAGCHVFVEKPLSTNTQEAADIVGLARARNRKVGIGQQYRLRPSLIEARRRLAQQSIGPLRLVAAALAQPWLAAHRGPENSWRFDPKIAGGGILADAGDHLVDALLWTTGRSAQEVAAFQHRLESGLDLVTAASLRLDDGTPAVLALSGISTGSIFELTYWGERGCLRATDQTLVEQADQAGGHAIPLAESIPTIDANFVAAIMHDEPLCCPAEQALDTVRLLEAIARSAGTGQVVRLV